MRLRIRTVIVCTMILALFLQATRFAGISSALFWGISFFSILEVLFDKSRMVHVACYKYFVVPAFLFLSVSLFSIIMASAAANNLWQFVASIKIWVSYLVNFLFLAMTAASLPKEVMEKELRQVAWFSVGICVIPFFLGTVQAFFPVLRFPFYPPSLGQLYWKGRYYTLFLNPNGHSAIAFVAFSLAEYLKLAGQKGKKSDRKDAWLTLFQVSCFINMCMSASRGTLVAVIFSWIFYEWMIYTAYRKIRFPRRDNLAYGIKRGACMAVCAAVLYYSCNIIPTIIPQPVHGFAASAVLPVQVHASNRRQVEKKQPVTRDYFEHGSDISNQRFEKWLYAFQTIPKSPLYGVGLYSDDFISCHNAYFTVMLSYGFLGLAAYASMLLYLWKMIRKRCMEPGTWDGLRKYAYITCCMIGILVIGLTNDVLIFTFEFVNVFAYYFMGYAMRGQKERCYGQE